MTTKTSLIENPAVYWQAQAEKMAAALKDKGKQLQWYRNYTKALESLVTTQQRLNSQSLADELMRREEVQP